MLKSVSRPMQLKLGIALLVMFALIIEVPAPDLVKIAAAAAAYLLVSYQVIITAFKTLFKRLRMSEQFLMTVATFGAFALGDYAEAIAIMVFYQIGDLFENYASGRARGEISSLLSLKPTKVRRILPDGSEEIVKPRKIKIGDTIRVLAGESIALDGYLLAGRAAIDMSAMTGESEPAAFKAGDEIPSGCINMGQVIELKVSRDYRNSSIMRLLNLIEDAAANKSKPEALITRFAVYYTPIVVAAAVILALVPVFVSGESYSDWINRALVFLVVSCPCALVLSVPLSFFSGLGSLSKLGIMVKGSIYIENLAHLTGLALDKTGTITRGRFSVAEIVCTPGVDKQDLLSTVYAMEQATTHPIGHAVCAYCRDQGLTAPKVSGIQEHAGMGLEGSIDGQLVRTGRPQYIMQALGLKQMLPCTVVGTEVAVSRGDQLLGLIILRDEPKPEAKNFFAALKRLGLKSYMITGDKQAVAQEIASELNISECYAQQLPQDKLNTFTRIKAQNTKLGYVGDGINDAPVLAASDVGIAMGQFGSAAAVEAADVVIMNDDLTKIPVSIEMSRRILFLAMQNIYFVILVKLGILIAGALGYANIWIAVLGDVGLCVLAVLNAMRALYWAKAYQK